MMSPAGCSSGFGPGGISYIASLPATAPVPCACPRNTRSGRRGATCDALDLLIKSGFWAASGWRPRPSKSSHQGEHFMAETRAAFKEGLEDVVATSSSICYIDGDSGLLSYRGYNIHDL